MIGDVSTKILSDIVIYNKYAKYIPELKRRESYNEIINRYLSMMKDRYPALSSEIDIYGGMIHSKKILPSMRALQFAGKAIERNESRIYNCSYLPIDDYRAFSEIMFLLLGGTGVGYSVQRHHVYKLPSIYKPVKTQKYLVGDSIEGWADSVRHLMSAYFGFRSTKPKFDFSDIRSKGSRLITAGGKAPGPEPLKTCLFKIETLLERKTNGDKLTPLEVHDICCHVADAVLAGGIRRAALISLFSPDDEEMLTCKFGNWWELNPQRGRANNSAVLNRNTVTKDQFLSIWEKIKASHSGEPGISFTNNNDWGVNPCHEISLRPYQFCNLCEVNVSNIENNCDLYNRVAAASFFGTLQAGFTDFHYLRDVWKKTTEKEALLGIGMTGITSSNIQYDVLQEAAMIARIMNKDISDIIGIKKAARVTTVKPSGTTSCVLGTSSGIHPWYAKYYIRRMQMTKNEPLYQFLKENHPELVVDYKLIPNSAVMEIPQKAPDNSILKDEPVDNILLRVKKYNDYWIKPGHRKGDNRNNVSATISLKDDEWDHVGKWMWDNKESFSGLSVLPYDGGTYVQPPFEEITEDRYNDMIKKLKGIDLSRVIEETDETKHSSEIACSGNSCEII